MKFIWRKTEGLSSWYSAWGRNMQGGYRSFKRLLWIVLIVYSLSAVTVANEMPAEIAFNIPRQRADLSLISFAEQADITLLFPLEKMADKETNALRGRYSIHQALSLMLMNTGLKPVISESGQVSIQIDTTFEGNNDMNYKKNKLTYVLSRNGIDHTTCFAF